MRLLAISHTYIHTYAHTYTHAHIYIYIRSWRAAYIEYRSGIEFRVNNTVTFLNKSSSGLFLISQVDLMQSNGVINTELCPSFWYSRWLEFLFNMYIYIYIHAYIFCCWNGTIAVISVNATVTVCHIEEKGMCCTYIYIHEFTRIYILVMVLWWMLCLK